MVDGKAELRTLGFMPDVKGTHLGNMAAVNREEILVAPAENMIEGHQDCVSYQSCSLMAAVT